MGRVSSVEVSLSKAGGWQSDRPFNHENHLATEAEQ